MTYDEYREQKAKDRQDAEAKYNIDCADDLDILKYVIEECQERYGVMDQMPAYMRRDLALYMATCCVGTVESITLRGGDEATMEHPKGGDLWETNI